MKMTTCLTLADALTKEATNLRKSKDDSLGMVKCFNGLEAIHNEVYTNAGLDKLDTALESNGTCDVTMELIRIMNMCMNNFDEKDKQAKYNVAHEIMNQVYFLNYLHMQYINV